VISMARRRSRCSAAAASPMSCCSAPWSAAVAHCAQQQGVGR
jgi:hypothetical protein